MAVRPQSSLQDGVVLAVSLHHEFEEGRGRGVEPALHLKRGHTMEQIRGGGLTGINRTTADGYA